MKFKTFVVSISAFLASVGAFALPNPCNRTFDDSTCMGPRAVRNMPIPVPTAVTKDVICGLIDCKGTNITSVTPGNAEIPTGYREVTIATGPHFGGDLGPEYYASLGYPIISGSIYSAAYRSNNILVSCNNDTTTRRVIYYPSYTTVDPFYGNSTTVPSKTVVCEPVGTRKTLVKDTQGQTLTLTLSDINKFALPGTIGAVAAAAGSICQAKGYIDATPNSATSWWRGSGCDQGDSITRYSGTGWIKDAACYNSVLTGVQCYK